MGPKKKGSKKEDKKGQISFRGRNADNGEVGVNRNYLVNTGILRLRKRQRNESDLAELIHRRNRLAYDDVALENFNAGEGRIASSAYRALEHERLVIANSNWEDFLYYQNSINRWDRLNSLLPSDQQRERIQGINQGPWMYNHNADRSHFLRAMLDYYDMSSIGGEEYRQGLRTITGMLIESEDSEPQTRPIGPEELHIWTPPTKRVPVGLRNEEDVEVGMRSTCRVSQLELDIEAINAEQDAHEFAALTPALEGEVLEYNTHAERRAAEGRRYWSEDNALRPTTSNIRQNEAGDNVESFGELRTDQGLFIAAKETSRDWLTSYDCLGKLEAGWTANIPPYNDPLEGLPRRKPDKGKNAAKSRADVPEPENWRLYVPMADKRKRGRRKPKRKAAVLDKDQNADSEDEWDEDVVTAAVARRAAAEEERGAAEGDYDYDYEDNEFIKPKRPCVRPYKRLYTTASSGEATDGRREWHMNMVTLDSSPPTSPPKVPSGREGDAETIPEGIDDTDLPPLRYPRCPHKTKGCRAWWSHNKEKCWRAKVETRGASDIEDPVIPLGSELLPIARSGREVYRNRLKDHYGRLIDSEEIRWPAFGIRVPYAPLTTMDDIGGRNDDEDGGQQIPGVRSMAVPIITKSQRGWRKPVGQTGGYDPGDAPPPTGDDEESDDDGDIFAEAYFHGSFPDGRPHSPVPSSDDQPPT